ncbi:MAG: YdcF family protein [Vicinamibacterales bacterium]
MKRFLSRLAALAALLLLIAALAAPRLGAWLVVEDPLQTADAIFVLGGTMFQRPLEAVDLYHEGWAPRMLLMRQIADDGEIELQRRGVPFQREIDVQVDVLTRLGVPRSAIQILDEQNSTRDEADTLLAVVAANRWSRVIVVTSKQHTRRARLVMNRRLAGTGSQAIVRASRYDRADVDGWWRNRSTLRFTLFETQRLVAYWLRLAD